MTCRGNQMLSQIVFLLSNVSLASSFHLSHSIMVKLLILFLLLVKFSSASHYRGGTTSWKFIKVVEEDSYEIEVDYTFTWLYTAADQCAGNPYSGGGSWSNDGNSDIAIMCTEFDPEQAWMYGPGSYTFIISESKTYFRGFTGCCMVGGMYGGMQQSSWNLPLYIDIRNRSDTKQPNTSPVALVPAEIILQIGCSASITLPVVDPDGDSVVCKYAIEYEDCGSICQTNYTFITLNETTCTLTYNGYNATDLTDDSKVAISLIAEDRPLTDIKLEDKQNTKDDWMSKIGIQFMLLMKTFQNETCSSTVEFTSESPVGGSCYSVGVNGTYETNITLTSSHTNRSIVRVAVLGPQGINKTSITNVVNNTYRMSFSWTPTSEQTGKNAICFIATDSHGIQSEFRCIYISTQGVPCDEVNECTSGVANCNEFASCTNTVGSYECECGDNFTGNGFNCTIDPCFLPGSCLAGNCVGNKYAGFRCICEENFAGEQCNHALFCTKPEQLCEVI